MTETINALPQNNLTFENDTINFLAREDASRFDKQFAGSVYRGGKAPISASLSHTVSELEAWVHGYYVTQPATIITYIPNRRSYVFVDSVETRSPEVVASGGAGSTFKLRSENIVVIECDVGSSQPTLSVPGLVPIFYADTDATSVTSVVDIRNLSPIVSSTKTIDPEGYELVGDDATDNLAAFQAMVDALPSGSIIRFGQGIYRFSDTIKVSKRCVIEGVGNSQLGTVFRITNAIADAIEITSTEQVILRNFVLDSSIPRASGSGLLISGNALLHRIDNITFTGHQTQLKITSGRGWSIRDCYFLETSFCDIDIQNSNPSPDNDALITGNVFISAAITGTQAIRIGKSVGLSILGNRFITHEQGVVVDVAAPSAGLIISNNTFREQSLAAISLFRSGGSATFSLVEISNNLIGTTGPLGIVVGPGAGGVFVDGVIVGNQIVITASNGVAIRMGGDIQWLIAENNISLPNSGSDTSVCIELTSFSSGVNVGHNGYRGKTFVLKNGVNSVVAPYLVPVSVSIDPPSIAASTQVEAAAAFPGASVGDTLILNRPTSVALPAALEYVGCRVSATDVLSVFLFNSSGSPIDPGPATWIGMLFKVP